MTLKTIIGIVRTKILVNEEKMNKIEAIVFDLDGTLTDSKKNIYEAIMAAFKDLNIKETIIEEEFGKYIGLTFQEIFEDLGIEVDLIDEFFEAYKSHYYKLLHLTSFYPTVLDTIKTLDEKQIKICLLTTKAQDQADYIIDQLDLRKYFTYVMGRRPDVSNKPSAEPLELLLSDITINKENAVMVGDTEMDINCGKNAGVKTVAVKYGYRTLDQLIALEPDIMVDSLNEILEKLDL